MTLSSSLKQHLGLMLLVGCFALFTLGLSSSAHAQHTLKIEVAVVYGMGGAQPVSHTSFRLLDASARHLIEEEFGLGKTENSTEPDTSASESDGTVAIQPLKPINPYEAGPNGFAVYAQACFDKKELCGKGWDVLYQHTVQMKETDLHGEATFEDLPAGRYHLYGYTETRGGEWIFWNHGVNVNGEKAIELSQANAGYIAE